jgi:glycine cleavage system H protein
MSEDDAVAGPTDDGQLVQVEGFLVRLDLAYEPDGHLWVAPPVGPTGNVRIGLDPLGVETTGTVAHLVVGSVGTRVRRGEPLGSLEAEKFVGPLVAPLTGVIRAVNPALATPRQVVEDPYGTWVAEVLPEAWEEESAQLVRGADRLPAWFADEVRRFRLEGVLAQ